MQSFISQNPDYQEEMVEKMKQNHFMNHLGFKPQKMEPGLCEGTLKIEPHHRQHIGFLHGGVIATLADLVAGFASYSLIRKDQVVVTAEMKIAYLNPGIGDTAFCKGYVIKAGQKLHFCEADIFVENEGIKTLVARGYATYALIDVK